MQWRIAWNRGYSPSGAHIVINQIKEMARRSELYLLRRAHCTYSNLVPLLALASIEALCIAGKRSARIDVNVM